MLENRCPAAMFPNEATPTLSTLDRLGARFDADRTRRALERLLHRFDGFDELVRVEPDRGPATGAGDVGVELQPPDRLPHLMRALRALEHDLMGADASHFRTPKGAKHNDARCAFAKPPRD